MKFGVLGAGAIGTMLGGRLAAAGENVVLVGRAADTFHAHGLTISDYRGRSWRVPSTGLTYATRESALVDCDVVFVTVKRTATETAVRALHEALAGRPAPVLVPFQNGVHTKEPVEAAAPGARVLAAMVPFNVVMTDPFGVHQATSGALVLERPRVGVGSRETTPDGAGVGLRETSDAVARALAKAEFEVEATEHIAAIQWSKLILNLNNAVNALSGLPLREQLSMRPYRLVLAEAMDEALLSLRAAALPTARLGPIFPWMVPLVLRLPTPLFRAVAGSMLAIDEGARSSMADDVERRKPTEIDYLSGEVVRLGERFGVATPVNRAIIARIRAAESAHAGSPKLAPDAILNG